MLKTASILLTAALGIAPPAQEPPASAFLEPGQAIRCGMPNGCYLFNEPGLQEAISQAFEAGHATCRGPGI
jgi:hypothetical protein